MKELERIVHLRWQHRAAGLLLKLAHRLCPDHRVVFEQALGSRDMWIADAWVKAHLLEKLTEMLFCNPDESLFFGRELLARARELIEIVEGSRRADVPVGGNVLAFARRP